MKSVKILYFMAVILFLCTWPTFGIIYFNDGLTHDIDYEIVDSVSVDWQTPYMYTTVNVLDGGKVHFLLRGYENSRINVLGGEIVSGLLTNDSSQVDITGGLIHYLECDDSSQADITGGSMGDLLLEDQSEIQIFGSGFLVDGQPLGHGELTSILGGWPWEDPQRHLTGTLLSGELISSYFWIGHDAKIVLIPEPASVMLLGLGGLAIARRLCPVARGSK